MIEIKSVERLRAAIEAERSAAEAVVEYPVEKTDAAYRDAKAATDKAVRKVERQLQNAAEQTRERRERGEEGSIVQSGGPLGGGGISGAGMITVNVSPSRNIDPLVAATGMIRRGLGRIES